MPKTAEILSTDGRQLIRLPADVQLPDTEMDFHRNEKTGEITLTSRVMEAERAKRLKAYFKMLEEEGPVEEDFLLERDRTPAIPRDLF